MMVRNRSSRPARRAAFTLMEMMVVVAIIVALAGIGIFYMAGQADEGNKAKARADIKNIEAAVLSYKLNHEAAGGWPTDLEQLVVKDDQGYGPYIANPENLLDPWGKRYVYDRGGQRSGGVQPDIYTTTPDGYIIGNWTKRLVK